MGEPPALKADGSGGFPRADAERYAWQDSNLRPLGPQPNALSPELQALNDTKFRPARACRATFRHGNREVPTSAVRPVALVASRSLFVLIHITAVDPDTDRARDDIKSKGDLTTPPSSRKVKGRGANETAFVRNRASAPVCRADRLLIDRHEKTTRAAGRRRGGKGGIRTLGRG